jgi:hypothetical protein
MNDKTWTYTRDLGALYREATAKIEALEAQLKQNNTKHMEVLNKHNVAVVENIRLNKEVERLQAELGFTIKALYASPYNLALAAHSDKRFSGYETIHINKAEVNWNDDLTVRDHIAIAAMEGILARMESTGSETIIATQAYKQADAMLKARNKT